MKKSLIILATFLSYFAQAQFGIVQDKDGFANVGDEKSTSSKIVGKVNSNSIYPIDTDEENSKWYLVEYKPEKAGYVCYDRIKKLEDFETISPTSVNDSKIEFSVADYIIQLETQKFNTINRVINMDNYLVYAIDNSDFYGTDGEIPITEFKSFKISFKGKEISIPKEYFSNLYNANLSATKLTYNKELNQYYLFGTYSDGAAVYDSLWILENGKIVEHFVQLNAYA
ncbi:hypothetical protein [Empedobacter brevis]|uniref:hypothetical protein n=1 Tax=Empedobacter brevis TaxID=247 RepID=UPI0039B09E74